jgi:hypothetical protein
MKKIFDEWTDGVVRAVKEKQTLIPTGLDGLDEILGGGLQSRRLVVITGPPHSGKSRLIEYMAKTHKAQNMGAGQPGGDDWLYILADGGACYGTNDDMAPPDAKRSRSQVLCKTMANLSRYRREEGGLAVIGLQTTRIAGVESFKNSIVGAAVGWRIFPFVIFNLVPRNGYTDLFITKCRQPIDYDTSKPVSIAFDDFRGVYEV